MRNSLFIAAAFCAFCVATDVCVPAAFADAPSSQKSDSAKKKKKKRSSDEKSSPSKKSSKKAKSSKSDDEKKGAAALSGGEWREPDKYERRLKRNVLSQFKTWKPSAVEAFLKDEENCKDLARWELIRACGGGESFGDFKKFTQKSATRRFLAEFTNDLDWAEGYLYSAPPENALFAIQLLKAFSDKDPEVQTVPVVKKIATGVAGEFSRRGWFDDEFEKDKEEARKKGPTRIYARFKFFADSWREKRLNVLFDDLDYWDTRIVVGVTGRTNNIYFGSEDSLRWGQDNVKLPEAGYASTRDIFQMPYRLWNKIGDSVHTNDYYAPFREWYQRNQLKMAREVGCVCGGVSHYGASAACANGVPAVTMGEPGHCAFAVRVGKKWRDNNSISWERSLHWRIWDETDWEFLHLTQEVCGDPEKTIPSFRIATLARLAASEDEKPGTNVVLSLYEYALKKQPLNFPVWREYLRFAAEKKKDDKNFWKDVHKNIVESFLPSFPASGAVTLCKYVYPTLLPLLGSDDEKIALYADFWEKAESPGAGGRWNWEAVWDYQAKTVGEGAGPKTYAFSPKDYNAKTPVAPGNDAAKRAYKEKIGAIVASRAKYGEAFEKWKNGTPR